MNLVPWRNKGDRNNGTNAFENALMRFRRDMDDVFLRFFGGALDSPAHGGGFGWGPHVDLAETDKEITVTAELPGVNPKDIDISVTGNVLSIRGEKKSDKEEQRADFHYVERRFGSFQRSIQLPASVDQTNVEAKYIDGVLTVTLVKHPDAKPKQITVKNG